MFNSHCNNNGQKINKKKKNAFFFFFLDANPGYIDPLSTKFTTRLRNQLQLTVKNICYIQ